MTDLEIVASHIYQTGNLPTPEVDEAWMRICATLADKTKPPEEAGWVRYLRNHSTATASDVVSAGLYATRNTAHVVAHGLTHAGRIRRVSHGVYALANPGRLTAHATPAR